MVRLAKVGLAIVIIVSVASILITPDPSDDVDGVIARHNIVNAVVVPVSVSQSHSLPPVTFWFAPVAMHRSTPHNVLDLACVRLCSRPGSARDIPQRFCHSSFLLHFLEEPWRTLEFGIHMRSSRRCSTQTFTVRGDSPLLQKVSMFDSPQRRISIQSRNSNPEIGVCQSKSLETCSESDSVA